MNEQEPTTVNVAGIEYNVADLTPDQIYCVKQLFDLQRQTETLSFQLDQKNTSYNVFLARFVELTKASDPQE